MPFAGFENFNACLTDGDMVKRYPDEETRKKVCGALQAKHERKQSHNTQMRELKAKISFDKFDNVDGGLLVRNVRLLGSGTWIDSNIQTPLYYPAETLQKYAGNWIDRSLWNRHSGGSPRAITDKIGEIRTPRFMDNAVFGDLWLHEKTQNSKDVAEMIKAGLVDYVSVEHGGKEIYNPNEKRYEAEQIVFGGVAVVNQGACKVCTINNESTLDSESHSWLTEENQAMVETKSNDKTEQKSPDILALEAQLEEAKTANANRQLSELEAAKAKITELVQTIKDQERKLAQIEHDGRVKELEREIATLKVQPVYHTNVTGQGTIEPSVRKLSEIESESPYKNYQLRDFGEV
jgi:hypothetical protein